MSALVPAVACNRWKGNPNYGFYVRLGAHAAPGCRRLQQRCVCVEGCGNRMWLVPSLAGSPSCVRGNQPSSDWDYGRFPTLIIHGAHDFIPPPHCRCRHPRWSESLIPAVLMAIALGLSVLVSVIDILAWNPDSAGAVHWCGGIQRCRPRGRPSSARIPSCHLVAGRSWALERSLRAAVRA